MPLPRRSFLTTQDFTRRELEVILATAASQKKSGWKALKSKPKLALLFFNPSLRTRSSFELAAFQLGGHATTLQPGKDAWPMEVREGVPMDGEAEEHVKDAARVLGRFFDAVCVRCFPKFQDWATDRQDAMLHAVARYAGVPVVNMETIVHPCQELALALTMKEKMKKTDGKKFLLTWTFHPKGLNTAVANSAALISTKMGMNLTILRPPGYDLDPMFMDQARENARANGGSVEVTDSIEKGYAGADFVYCKSWGNLAYFGKWEEEKKVREPYRHFIVDAEKMRRTNDAWVSHCLPMRRNVKMTDEVADSKKCLIIDEAENRLHGQRAMLTHILG
ncbi:MAG: N-acetylornithine carbamoyltransferase [Planctomycetes bacterium]|nr:N-acetylornithine carbamoyltransferase [Planctomycetota bacterium]